MSIDCSASLISQIRFSSIPPVVTLSNGMTGLVKYTAHRSPSPATGGRMLPGVGMEGVGAMSVITSSSSSPTSAGVMSQPVRVRALMARRWVTTRTRKVGCDGETRWFMKRLFSCQKTEKDSERLTRRDARDAVCQFIQVRRNLDGELRHVADRLEQPCQLLGDLVRLGVGQDAHEAVETADDVPYRLQLRLKNGPRLLLVEFGGLHGDPARRARAPLAHLLVGQVVRQRGIARHLLDGLLLALVDWIFHVHSTLPFNKKAKTTWRGSPAARSSRYS